MRFMKKLPYIAAIACAAVLGGTAITKAAFYTPVDGSRAPAKPAAYAATSATSPVLPSSEPPSAPAGEMETSVVLTGPGLIEPSSAAEPSSQEPEEIARAAGIYKKLLISKKDNPDTVGWLRIKGTKCDYAVMQSDDNEYYLKRNEQKEKSSRGALYADFRCRFDGDLSKNTVIYGHSMKDGSMFTQLFVYKRLSALQKQPIINFAVDDGEDRWKIFACMITDTGFNYIEPNPSDEEFAGMVNEICRRSLFETDVDIEPDDKILLLSTCTYEYESDDVRFVVAARRMREGENEDVQAWANEETKTPEL
ncbi:MAG: class B sortase [Clostridia bacterium]|nr:class B sortase [Clostridia bacterium]